MDTRLIHYYKKQLYGGRSIIARFTDYVILRFALLFTLFIILVSLSRSIMVSLLIAVFITIAVSLALVLARRRRIKHFIERDMLRIKKKCLLEELTIMNTDEYTNYLIRLFEGLSDITVTECGITAQKGDALYFVYHNHPASTCDIGDVLKVYRQYHEKNIVIVSLSEFSDSAQKFCTGQKIELVSGESILKMAAEKNMLPDEEAAQQKASKEMNDTIITFGRLKQAAFNKTKVKAYILCGLVVMCWPFIIGFRIYYPIIAVFCFIMAAVTFHRNKSHEESRGIGIS